MAVTLQPAATLSAASGTGAELSALLHGVGVAPLDAIGWIRVTGEDRVRWLNGMVTNFVQHLAPGEGCYNFVLNAQGRIQGDLTAFAETDAFVLKTGRNQIPVLMALLDRFIIMDDVELADVSTECAGLSVTGPQAAAVLDRLGLSVGDLAPMHRKSANRSGFPVVLLHEASPLVPRFEVWGAPETIEPIRHALFAEGAAACSPEAVDDLRILEGTPRYGTDIRDKDLPQETAQTRALHFAKGCYLGQEIVERIHSRGNVHRTFTGFSLSGTLPPAGTPLTGEGKPIGELTSVAAIQLPEAGSPTGTVHVQLALGYVRREALDRSLQLEYSGGIATPISLPYPIS